MNIINPYSYAGVQDGQVVMGLQYISDSSTGIWISRDFGETWSLSTTVPYINGWSRRCIVANKGKSFFTTLYKSGYTSLWSQDGGSTWTSRPCYGIGDISDDGQVIAMPSENGTGTDVSRDGGQTWSLSEGTLTDIYETHVSWKGDWISINTEGYYDYWRTNGVSGTTSQYGPSDPYVSYAFKSNKGVLNASGDILVIGGSPLAYSVATGYFREMQWGAQTPIQPYKHVFMKDANNRILFGVYSSNFSLKAVNTNYFNTTSFSATGSEGLDPGDADGTNKYIYVCYPSYSTIARVNTFTNTWTNIPTPVPFTLIGANYVLP